MKTIDFQPEIEISENFKLCAIWGEETQQGSFKEFEKFKIAFDLGIKDDQGGCDLLIIEITREQYNSLAQENYGFSWYQIPSGKHAEDIIIIFNDLKNRSKIEKAITELIDRYELQGFDH